MYTGEYDVKDEGYVAPKGDEEKGDKLNVHTLLPPPRIWKKFGPYPWEMKEKLEPINKKPVPETPKSELVNLLELRRLALKYTNWPLNCHTHTALEKKLGHCTEPEVIEALEAATEDRSAMDSLLKEVTRRIWYDAEAEEPYA